MNFVQLFRTKLLPSLRQKYGESNVTASSDPRVPGVSLTIHRESTANCMFGIDENELGLSLTCITQNVNTGNEYFVMESPEALFDNICNFVDQNKETPVEGRTAMRLEVLEQELGTLTGVNAPALVNGDLPDDFSDAANIERDIK